MKSREILPVLGAALCLVAACLPLSAVTTVPMVTYDVVRDFNQTNTPGALFTYGVGAVPAQFTPMAFVNSIFNGLRGWIEVNNGITSDYHLRSVVVFNGTGATQIFETVTQPTNLLRLDPELTAGSIVRFTVPTTGNYDISGLFQGIDNNMHSSAVLVFAGGVQQFSSTIPGRGFGTQDPFSSSSVHLNAGDTIDFIVKSNDYCCWLSTGLAATISRPIAAPDVTSQARLSTSGYIYSRATGLFSATLWITNTGSTPIAGPIQVVFKGLGAGIRLANRTGWIGPDPYLTIPNSTTLLPGATVLTQIQFSDPTAAWIIFTPAVYAGTL
jgi:hypothetical protein